MLLLIPSRHKEPIWENRPLSAWLADLNELSPDRVSAAMIAVRGIGTNAVPFLKERLMEKDSHIMAIVHRICLFLRIGAQLPTSSAARHTEAVRAFRVLGTNASNALPDLGNLLTGPASDDKDTAISVAQSIAALGDGAKQMLIASLYNSNRNVREAALTALTVDFAADAPEAMPAVLECTRDKDPEIRSLALYFVSRFGKDENVKRKVLSVASEDPDKAVRQLALKELAKMNHRQN